MLLTSAGVNPRPPGLQSDGASNWATEAGKRDRQVKLWQIFSDYLQIFDHNDRTDKQLLFQLWLASLSIMVSYMV